MILSDGITVAVIGAVGPTAAALATVVVPIIQKVLEQRARKRKSKKGGPQRHSAHRQSAKQDVEIEDRHKSLHGIRIVLIGIELLCLLIVGISLLKRGEENALFVQIHSVLIALAVLICVALLALQIFPAVKHPVGKSGKSSESSAFHTASLWSLTVLFVITFGFVCGEFSRWLAIPINERYSVAAFKEFNSGNYGSAIQIADQCTSVFGRRADEIEKDLSGTPELPEGPVGENQRPAIFKNGLLNDLASCYWIKGRSAQQENDKGMAEQAYSHASTYRHALTGDPKGFFWSPARDAADRLLDLH